MNDRPDFVGVFLAVGSAAFGLAGVIAVVAGIVAQPSPHTHDGCTLTDDELSAIERYLETCRPGELDSACRMEALHFVCCNRGDR